MAHRYCAECDKWYPTSEYGVSESGETVCPVDGHGAVSGFIMGSRNGPSTVETPYSDEDASLSAAERQGLL